MVFISQKNRAIILFMYFAILVIANYIAFDSFLPDFGNKGLWFYTGFASILLGNLLITPYYTKPVDSISYTAFSIIAFLLVNQWNLWSLEIKIMYIFVITYSSTILIVSFASIFLKDNPNESIRKISNSFRIISEVFGNEKIIFSSVIIFSIFAFHLESIPEVLTIFLSWSLIVLIKPEYILVNAYSRISKIWSTGHHIESVGTVVAYQTPNVILVRVEGDNILPYGSVVLINDPHTIPKIAISLDLVGRDQGLLLRCFEVEINDTLRHDISMNIPTMPYNTVAIFDIASFKPNYMKGIYLFNNFPDFVGLVSNESSINTLYFEVIKEEPLEEGRLIEVVIKEKPVLYQIVDGFTKEEITHQKHTFGFAQAKAKKIGFYNKGRNNFEIAKWVPKINTPVFIKSSSGSKKNRASIGSFPKSDYTVSINDINYLVTHNTAILGILGIGKSMLAIELIERMIDSNIKVVCLDLTNQYATELKEHYSIINETKKIDAIINAGLKEKEDYAENPEDGGSINNLTEALSTDLDDFLSDEKAMIKIYNPSQFHGTKQTHAPGNFQRNNRWQRSAPLWSITPVEVTAIITSLLLDLVKNKMSDKAKVCIVFEEAHALVPEWGSVTSDGDKSAANTTARAILQGRKYGLGCLLITQRTANVTKTILNQCNSIFAMRTFDDTGKDFLSNYIGKEYANVLPLLSEREAVFFGKASSSENPVLIRLNDQSEFRDLEGVGYFV